MRMMKVFMTKPEGSIVLRTDEGVIVGQLDKDHPALTCNETIYRMISPTINKFVGIGLLGTQVLEEVMARPVSPVPDKVDEGRPLTNESPIDGEEIAGSTLKRRRK
jgi:hypothetical protein